MLLILGLCGQSVFLKVPHFHRPEETLHAESLFMEPGGKGYNQAVAARRMGADVVFAGAVGPDSDGECCRDRLVKEGIAPRLFTRQDRTAYAAILTDASGENRVTVFPGAQMEEKDLDQMAADFDRARMILLTPEIPESVFARAVEMAKARHLPIVLNPAPFVPYVRHYLKDAWCLTPNRSEARAMLNLSEDDPLLPALQNSPYPRMVVTLGGDGAVCIENGVCRAIPSWPVQAVDTTGAGDCLNGALCACLLSDMPLAEAAAHAVRAASLSVTAPHALDGMPWKNQVFSET